LGWVACYKLLQHLSTLFGLAVLSLWFAAWYRSSEPSHSAPTDAAPSYQRVLISGLIFFVAFAGAIVRAAAGVGYPASDVSRARFLGELVVTGIALLWWQLVALGFFSSRWNNPIPVSQDVESSAEEV